jgi:hypothetical protein
MLALIKILVDIKTILARNKSAIVGLFICTIPLISSRIRDKKRYRKPDMHKNSGTNATCFLNKIARGSGSTIEVYTMNRE